MIRQAAFVVMVMCVLAEASAGPPASMPGEIGAVLKVRLGEFKWEKAPFEKVIAELAKTTGTNLIVDWARLKDNGLEPDATVTIKAAGLTLEELLQLIAARNGWAVELGCYVVGNNLVVTSKGEALKRQLTVVVYETGDLLKAHLGKDTEEAAVERLMKTLATSIEKETWALLDNMPWEGAETDARGTMGYYNAKLIVQTSPAIQAKVAALLQELRKKPA